ncbi:LysR family transcriptional regulator [Naasia aerilata]|uniref:HTH lysR-type domain-containing protein n=1 Tax=Naasia aerilata TaxID=1162966 RepID=A0ABN6XLR6_9MICO|nr:LysR family transcriptional regulator [Naasia aerilata]BDZ44581.1 hypothetical protein GCM10025866_04900 [Naasia aerilata]
MDVRRLELLRELGERGSITAVATATHRTPSAVSQQLKVLEREIGFPLTERSGRGIVLTDAGRTLARTATDIAVAIERAEAVWNAFVDAPAGEVSIATFPTAGQMFIPGLLKTAAATPGLSLVVSDRDPQLPDFPRLTNDFDVVLAHSPRGLAAGPTPASLSMSSSWSRSTWRCPSAIRSRAARCSRPPTSSTRPGSGCRSATPSSRC